MGKPEDEGLLREAERERLRRGDARVAAVRELREQGHLLTCAISQAYEYRPCCCGSRSGRRGAEGEDAQ